MKVLFLLNTASEPAPGRLDTRALIPGAVTRVHLPYRLGDGCLGLRVWNRPVYAEIGTVLIDAGGLRIEERMDDVARKDVAYVLPPITTGDVTMQPHYDADNEFSIRMVG